MTLCEKTYRRRPLGRNCPRLLVREKRSNLVLGLICGDIEYERQFAGDEILSLIDEPSICLSELVLPLATQEISDGAGDL